MDFSAPLDDFEENTVDMIVPLECAGGGQSLKNLMANLLEL